MRSRIFRVLAGVLAVLFLALLMAGDLSKFSLYEQFGFGVITVGFGLYAFLGEEASGHWLNEWFGFTPTKCGVAPAATKPLATGTKSDGHGKEPRT